MLIKKITTKLVKLIVSVFLFSYTFTFAQINTDSIIADDPLLAQMDSLDVLNFFNNHNHIDTLNIYNYSEDSIPVFSDEIYKTRLDSLDQITPFQLDYNNEVRRYIELYTIKRRGTISRVLGMSELYFPLFEQKLSQYKMPLELKYLAIIESALNPVAKSRVGASGLWQFMLATGKIHGLTVNSYVDERFDPEKSTDAACRYLKYLYKYFGNDWQLALAAYNCGPGNVNKAIRRSGGKKTFWEIRPYLPRETANYVPAFIAMNYIMNFHIEHNIYPNSPKYFHYEIDSIWVKNRVKFSQITPYLKITEEELRLLNPIYLLDEIPQGDGYPLYLPKSMIGDFLANEESIYNHSLPKTVVVVTTNTNANVNTHSTVISNSKTYYTVKRGDSLWAISQRYHTTVNNLKKWNNLYNKVLQPGMKIIVKR